MVYETGHVSSFLRLPVKRMLKEIIWRKMALFPFKELSSFNTYMFCDQA